jgi:hypothetical protein
MLLWNLNTAGQRGSLRLKGSYSGRFSSPDIGLCLGSDPGEAAVHAAPQLTQALSHVAPRLRAEGWDIQRLLLEGHAGRARRVGRR